MRAEASSSEAKMKRLLPHPLLTGLGACALTLVSGLMPQITTHANALKVTERQFGAYLGQKINVGDTTVFGQTTDGTDYYLSCDDTRGPGVPKKFEASIIQPIFSDFISGSRDPVVKCTGNAAPRVFEKVQTLSYIGSYKASERTPGKAYISYNATTGMEINTTRRPSFHWRAGNPYFYHYYWTPKLFCENRDGLTRLRTYVIATRMVFWMSAEFGNPNVPLVAPLKVERKAIFC